MIRIRNWSYDALQDNNSFDTSRRRFFLNLRSLPPKFLLLTVVGITFFLTWSAMGFLYLFSTPTIIVNPLPTPIIASAASEPPHVVRLHFHQDENENNREPLLAPNDCPITVLFTSDERSADVVVYNSDRGHATVMEDRQALRVQRPWQKVAVTGVEAAPNRKGLQRHHDFLKEGKANETFDFDLTYRLTSDAPAVYAYSYFQFSQNPLPYEQKRQDKLVSAFVSNCHPKNGRTLILKELMNQLGDQLDSFGSCENNANPEEALRQLGRWEQTGEGHTRWNIKITAISLYKFTIAMENCNEPDYVTEKYFQAMETGSVPIYLGTPTFRSTFMASPNSAIDVADYLPTMTNLSTPDTAPPEWLTGEELAGIKKLADRIKYLGSEEGREEYDSMLDWKKEERWKSSPFGQVVKVGRLPWSDRCRLAGLSRGLEWAKSGWEPPEDRPKQFNRPYA